MLTLRRNGATLGVSYVGNDELRAYTIPPRDVLHEDGFEIEAVLSEKPDTNRFAFPLDGWEDFEFFYQPALANENDDGSRWGPSPLGGIRTQAVDVANSWAIYRKDDGTKAFHVYRPRITDASGQSIWGALEYTDGVFTVEVPQAFLDAAAYPVVVDPTFGFTSAGASDDDPGGNLVVVKASSTPAASGTLDSATAWGRILSGTPQFNPAIYSDSAGVPNARLGFVDSGGTTFTGSDSQITTAIGGSVSITSGTQYWLGVSTNFIGGNNCHIKFDSGSGELYFLDNPGGWPSTVSGWTQVTGEKWSIYATYTTSGTDVTVNPTGFGLTASLGTPTVLKSGVLVSPTGFGLTASLGSASVSVGGNTTVAPTGLGMTTSLGTFSIENDTTVVPTGFGLAMSLGSFTVQANTTLTGLNGFGLTTALGTPSLSITSGITVTPTGFGLSVSRGTPTVVPVNNPTVQPNGFGLVMSRGTPSVISSGSVTVAPVGLGMVASLGIPQLVITGVNTPVGFGLVMSLGTPIVRVVTPIIAPPSPTSLIVLTGNTTVSYIADNGAEMPSPVSFTAGTTGPYLMKLIGSNGQAEPTGAIVTLVVQSVNGGTPVVDRSIGVVATGGIIEWDRLDGETDDAGDYLMQSSVLRSDGTRGRYPDGSLGDPLTILPALGGETTQTARRRGGE